MSWNMVWETEAQSVPLIAVENLTFSGWCSNPGWRGEDQITNSSRSGLHKTTELSSTPGEEAHKRSHAPVWRNYSAASDALDFKMKRIHEQRITDCEPEEIFLDGPKRNGMHSQRNSSCRFFLRILTAWPSEISHHRVLLSPVQSSPVHWAFEEFLSP